MGLDRLERWLLVCFLFCTLFASIEAGAKAACDNNCREVLVFVADQGEGHVNCYMLSLKDCWSCAVTNNGLCVDTTGPGSGNCGSNDDNQMMEIVTPCTQLCTLPPGGKVQASTSETQEYPSPTIRFVCTAVDDSGP